MSRARTSLIVAAIASVVALGVAEGVLRWIGRAPSSRQPSRTSPMLAADDRLGHVLTPGASAVEVQVGPRVRTVRISRLPDGHRVTRPLAEYPAASARPQVWLFGCSFTFGVMLSDEETFPWIAQTLLPEYEVVNFAVPAYSTLQMSLQLEDALQRGDRPAAVVLTYATFHDDRNACSRRWRNAGGMPFRYPCARLDSEETLTRSMIVRGDPGLPFADRLATVATMESALNRLSDLVLRSRDVTRRLIGEVVARCRREGIPVVIAVVSDSGGAMSLLQPFADDGVPILRIAPDYRRPGMSFGPHDAHTAPEGARWLGEHLASGLASLPMLRPHVQPPPTRQ